MAKLKVVGEPTFELLLSKPEAQILYDLLAWGVNGSGYRRELATRLYDQFKNNSFSLSEEIPSDMKGIVTFG